MASNRFSLKIRGDQENPGNPFRSNSKYKTGSTRFPFPEPSVQQKKIYEKFCKGYLRQPFVGTGATVSNQKEPSWTPPMKNWSLWSVWSSELSESIVEYCYEEEFIDLVNGSFDKEPIFQKNDWEDLELDGCITVRVTKADKDVQRRPYTEGFTLTCQQVCFEETEVEDDAKKKDKVHEKPPTSVKKKGKVIKLQAFSGLAEILATVVEEQDVLIICSGYLQNVGLRKVPMITLNCDSKNHTQILRLPGCQFDEINLVELVEPQEEDHRFRFTFGARGGKTVREITQHRNFNYELFGRNVMSSMAYDDGRWDFPVPVVKDTAGPIYDSLLQWDFSMFRERKVYSKSPRHRRPKPEVELNKTFTITSPPPTPKSRSIQLMKRVSNCVEFLLFIILSLFLIVIIVFIISNMEHVLGECSDLPVI